MQKQKYNFLALTLFSTFFSVHGRSKLLYTVRILVLWALCVRVATITVKANQAHP